jgi:hypothetical protein
MALKTMMDAPQWRRNVLPEDKKHLKGDDKYNFLAGLS